MFANTPPVVQPEMLRKIGTDSPKIRTIAKVDSEWNAWVAVGMAMLRRSQNGLAIVAVCGCGGK